MKAIPTKLKGNTRVKYSRDRQYYYLPEYSSGLGFWLSIKTITGEVPENLKSDPLTGYLEVKKDNGSVYYRELKSFNMWDIKSGLEETVEANCDLVADYLLAERDRRNR